MTDDRMDARLRAAGERWRTANSTAAAVEPPTLTEPADVVPPRPTRRRWGLLASAAAVAAALVVGGTFLLRDTHSGTTPTGDTAALEGHVWLLTDGHGAKSYATLYIGRDGNLVADDDCTLIGGKAALDGNTMTVTEQIVRYKSCTDAEFGPNYSADGVTMLSGVSTFTITADALTITRNNRELRFVLARQNTPVPTLDYPTLVGAGWAVVSAKDADGNPVTVGGDPALHIADDGTLTGSDGCNSLNGTVTLDGDRITFGQVGGTEKYCPGDAGATEKAILAFMQGTARETVVGGELTMTQGKAELVYRWDPAGGDTDAAQLQGVTWHLVDGAGTQLPSDTTVDFAGNDWTVQNGILRPRTAGSSDPLANLFKSSWHPWFVRDDRLYVLLNEAQASALVFANSSTLPTTPNEVDLAGPTWHLTSITSSADVRYRNGAPPAEDSTLTFTDSGFAVHHVCYVQQGSATTTKQTVTLRDGRALDAHPCPFIPGRDHAAQIVDSILSGAVHWTIRQDTLTLTKAGTGTLVYSRSADAVHDLPLVGTHWRLETAVNDQGTALPGADQTFTVDTSAHVISADGLNTTSGPVDAHDGTLTFGNLATTAIGSLKDDPVRDVIDEVVQHGDVSYKIAGNTLTLSRGAAQLIYRG